MSSPDHPSARDRAAETPPPIWWSPSARRFFVQYRMESGNYEMIHLDRKDGWFVDCTVEIHLPADAVRMEALSALAGVPHPGVEALAEVIDPPAFDPRGSVASPVNAYARGKRQRAALDAAGRVRALLGHTTTDTQETPA